MTRKQTIAQIHERLELYRQIHFLACWLGLDAIRNTVSKFQVYFKLYFNLVVSLVSCFINGKRFDINEYRLGSKLFSVSIYMIEEIFSVRFLKWVEHSWNMNWVFPTPGGPQI